MAIESKIKRPTLFLDRDGVLNQKLPNDYVKQPAELQILDGVQEALFLLHDLFYPILVITNQQGIGKGLMSTNDLLNVHESLNAQLSDYKRIHEFYYCPHLAAIHCNCRKPETGMFLQAQTDYPFIQWNRAWMVGDSKTDIQAAKKLGMKAVFIGDHDDQADEQYQSLLEFAQSISRAR